MENLALNFERFLWNELHKTFGKSADDTIITTFYERIMLKYYQEQIEIEENWKQLYFLTTNEQGQLV